MKIKELVKELENLGLDKEERKEVINKMKDQESDFEVNDVRFINAFDIDKIQQDELLNDLYILGCFNSWFIADILEIDSDSIEEIQKAGAYEALGKMLSKHIVEVQEKYQAADGYGYHFNSYDHSEEYLTYTDNENSIGYYAFNNK